jgi:hypothetical protein
MNRGILRFPEQRLTRQEALRGEWTLFETDNAGV